MSSVLKIRLFKNVHVRIISELKTQTNGKFLTKIQYSLSRIHFPKTFVVDFRVRAMLSAYVMATCLSPWHWLRVQRQRIPSSVHLVAVLPWPTANHAQKSLRHKSQTATFCDRLSAGQRISWPRSEWSAVFSFHSRCAVRGDGDMHVLIARSVNEAESSHNLCQDLHDKVVQLQLRQGKPAGSSTLFSAGLPHATICTTRVLMFFLSFAFH